MTRGRDLQDEAIASTQAEIDEKEQELKQLYQDVLKHADGNISGEQQSEYEHKLEALDGGGDRAASDHEDVLL